MTERHIFDDHASLVLRSLKGLVASHPTLSLIPSLKTVFNAAHDTNKVALICGGGAGHEPGSTGFVGRGLLSASVSGDTFASPSARQVYGGIKAVPSSKGTILIITNYTGDNLHFGLAAQQARADGLPRVGVLPVGDDVSVGRTKGALVGRRALAGTILVCKILGAAAEADWGYEETLSLGRAVTSGLASIAATLGHCHVPGRSEYAHIPDDTIEIGLGLHNEPGMWVVSPQPKSTELVARMLKLLLDQDDPERAFVPYARADALVLYVNNMGGMSVLEMYAVVDQALTQLADWGYQRPARVLCGTFMTSLNAPGFSLSLLNLTHITKVAATPVSVEQLLAFIDAPHGSAAWPGGAVYPAPPALAERTLAEKCVDVPKEVKHGEADAPKIFVSPDVLASALRGAAQAVYDSEPDLTRWDTIVGDGDCGETCAAGAKAVMNALDNGLGADGELVRLLRDLTELIDDTCGGTLGAIFSIFLAALAAEVRARAAATPDAEVDAAFWGGAAVAALRTLEQSTAARVGHRTVMDALIPFVETLGEGAGLDAAIAACAAGGEGTARLVAKLGRATYVGESAGALPPDPGAMSVVALTQGMLKGLVAAAAA